MRLAVAKFGKESSSPVHDSVTDPALSRSRITTPSVSETATTGMVMAGLPATVGLTRPAMLL